MSKVHEATLPVAYDGRTYYTANWRRFFLGQPEIERKEYADDRIRDRTEIRFTEVKDPRTLKALRRHAPAPAVEQDEADADGGPTSAMLDAATRYNYADSPLADAAQERAERNRKKYGTKPPHGHYPPDVVTIKGVDFAIYGKSVYRIRWHERETVKGGETVTTYRIQLIHATPEEVAAVNAKRGRKAAAA